MPESEDYIGYEPSLPGKPTSAWIDTTPGTSFGPPSGTPAFDVIVVGGGIAGIAAARLLTSRGRRVALLDARRVLMDVTGHTTAKVTAQHGLVYRWLRETRGELAALTYAEANLWGVNEVQCLVREHGIECDLERTFSCVYAEDEGDLEQLADEYGACRDLGLPAALVERLEAPFPIRGALVLEDQARFHPRKFLLGVLDAARRGGLAVYEHTRAIDITDGDPCEVHTERGSLKAREVVVTTNFPFKDTGDFYLRLQQRRSYALAVSLEGPVPDGMYYSAASPTHSFRRQPFGRRHLLIAGGEDHRPGRGGNEIERYRDLQRWAQERFRVADVLYHWSTQDNITADLVPYIGRSPGTSHVWVATGFNGWGMTTGMAASALLADLLSGLDNPWRELYDPSRRHPEESAPRYRGEDLVTPRGEIPVEVGIEDIPPNEGAVVEADGRRTAVWHSPDGRLHALSPKCAHMGCTVDFNEAEKTWDCWCHGSRYTAEGEVVHGPALHSLSPAPVPAEAT